MRVATGRCWGNRKVLCHNLVVLVHEMYELGITAEFGGTVPEEVEESEPRIIRFPGA